MTDIEVGRYALRTFSLHCDWTYTRDMLHGLDTYPYTILGPIGNNSNGVRTVWRDGVCTAQCLRSSYGIGMLDASRGRSFLPAPWGHPAPHKACTCGIYGALDYACLYKQFGYETGRIVAVIAAEGTTIIGSRGLRTQYARVVAWHADDGLYQKIAIEQFKDAEQFTKLEEMLIAYHLPVDTGVAGSGGGYRWWA